MQWPISGAPERLEVHGPSAEVRNPQCVRRVLSKLPVSADSLPMQVSEKRREARLLCAGLVEVHWVEADGTRSATIANLDDLSPSGVSLLLEGPLPPGTQIEFFHGGHRVSGAVRYCSSTELGWIAGVEFGPDSQWDPAACPPEHLLDPKSIPKDARMGEVVQVSHKVRSPISCLVLGDAMRRENG